MRKVSATADAERERTAYHEAGHAVLQLYLGLGVEGVSIVADHLEMTAGSSTHGGEWGKPAEKLGDEDDDIAKLRIYAEEAFWQRHAVARLAGVEAVRRFNPKRRDWKAGADDDYSKFYSAIERMRLDPESEKSIARYAKARVRNLVECYWPEIKAVATALLDGNGELIGADVERIACKSLERRRGKLLRW